MTIGLSQRITCLVYVLDRFCRIFNSKKVIIIFLFYFDFIFFFSIFLLFWWCLYHGDMSIFNSLDDLVQFHIFLLLHVNSVLLPFDFKRRCGCSFVNFFGTVNAAAAEITLIWWEWISQHIILIFVCVFWFYLYNMGFFQFRSYSTEFYWGLPFWGGEWFNRGGSLGIIIMRFIFTLDCRGQHWKSQSLISFWHLARCWWLKQWSFY